jgi:integrase
MWESANYYARIQFCGRQRWFNTQTADLERAIGVALRFHELLCSTGDWEKAQQGLFPRKRSVVGALTVGAYIDGILQKSTKGERTLRIYAGKLRTLVTEVFAIAQPAGFRSPKNDAHRRWLDAVHRVALENITAEKVQQWRRRRLQTENMTPLKEQRARRTIQSILRNVKSLFAPALRRLVPGEFPAAFFADSLPLEGARITPYLARIPDLRKFQAMAREELGNSADPHRREAYKIILLALFVGMRRDEIDTLSWKQINLTAGRIAICTNEYTETKTHGSERTVDMPKWLCELLRREQESHPRDIFVIRSGVLPNLRLKTSHHYRCAGICAIACKWLRGKGIDARQPIHALRKEYGSEMNRCHGIYAASKGLGHSNIRMTCDYYVGQKERFVIGEEE